MLRLHRFITWRLFISFNFIAFRFIWLLWIRSVRCLRSGRRLDDLRTDCATRFIDNWMKWRRCQNGGLQNGGGESIRSPKTSLPWWPLKRPDWFLFCGTASGCGRRTTSTSTGCSLRFTGAASIINGFVRDSATESRGMIGFDGWSKASCSTTIIPSRSSTD